MSTTPNGSSKSKLEMMAQRSRSAEERVAVGQLAIELMHEIRNPLEALGHLTYLGFEEADDPEKVRKYMRLAEEQVATLNFLVSQTLGFARSYSRKPVNIATVTEAALRIHRRTIDSRKVHLIKDLGEDAVAEVHSGELLQLFSNLIGNALDALPDDGKLTLRLRKRNGEIHFVIADNGSGIHPDHIADIFEPLFTTKEDGAGIGLALCKSIVERHGGKIRLRSSVRPGKSGTTFKISIPA